MTVYTYILGASIYVYVCIHKTSLFKLTESSTQIEHNHLNKVKEKYFIMLGLIQSFSYSNIYGVS